MVGPSTSVDEEATSRRRLKVGMVLLIGASGGLVALQVDPTPVQLAAAVVGSVALGFVLTTYIARMLREVQPEGVRERTRRTRAGRGRPGAGREGATGRERDRERKREQ